MESNIFNELNEKYREFKTNLKGGVGEFAAALALKYDVSEKIHIIRNVYVPLSDGKTAEIDLVIVHTTGIYVVECKNYSGWIFGSENNKMWTQTYANGQKYQFFNPMTQNKYHINALSRYLEVPDEYFVSYIVFGEQCELKKVPPNTDRTAIMDLRTLPKKTELDLHNRPYMFSDSVVDMFSGRISELTDRTGQKKREHIEQVKKAHPDKPNIKKSAEIDSGKLFVSSFFRF